MNIIKVAEFLASHGRAATMAAIIAGAEVSQTAAYMSIKRLADEDLVESTTVDGVRMHALAPDVTVADVRRALKGDGQPQVPFGVIGYRVSSVFQLGAVLGGA